MGVLGAAVIGLGVGRSHCEGYATHPKCRLVAVSDLIEERLSWAREKYGVETHKDYNEILARDDVDVVSVCTPDFTHVRLAAEALEADQYVLVEKPMALKLEDCDAMIRAAEKSGRMLSVDHCLRVSPLFSTIKALIDDGTLGDMAGLGIYHWRGSFLIKPGRWIQKRRYAGSMTLQKMCHSVDLAQWFGGELSEVYAVGKSVRKDFDYEQTVYINTKFKDGAIGLIAHTILGFPGRWTLWIIGSKASVYSESGRTSKGPISELRIKEHKEDLVEDHEYDKIVRDVDSKEFREMDVIAEYTRRYVDCILEDRKPPVLGQDGKKVVEICLASDLSIHEGKTIALPLGETPKSIAKTIARPDYRYLDEPGST